MMPKGSEAQLLSDFRRSATRERILAAAGAILIRYGYKATTMSAVAKDVGVSSPAIYWHFESKQVLIREVIRVAIQSIDSQVVRAVPTGNAERQFEVFVESYINAQLDWRLSVSSDGALEGYGMVQLLTSLTPEERLQLRPDELKLYLRLKGIIRQGATENIFDIEDVSVAALTILTNCDYLYTWYRPEGRLNRSAIIRSLTSVAKRIVGCPAQL